MLDQVSKISGDNKDESVKGAVNLSPVANAGKDLEITLPKNSITADASLSSDKDGKLSLSSGKK